MVLRLTKKLADKLKIKSLPENANVSFALINSMAIYLQ